MRRTVLLPMPLLLLGGVFASVQQDHWQHQLQGLRGVHRHAVFIE